MDRLLATLTAPPPGPGLVRGNDASDLETLASLAREPEIRDLAQGRRRVRLLWEACQIPDFRKLADDTHTRLCARVLGTSLAREAFRLIGWPARSPPSHAREGDIDTLMQRLAGVRVWSYIAARSDWVRDAPHWQDRAREAEDLLSDALHERLTARFVDRRAAHLVRRLEATEGRELLSAVTRRGEVVVEGHQVGHVRGFAFFPDPLAEGEEKKLVLRAARRALRDEMRRRVAQLESAADAALMLTRDQSVAWDGVPVARLRRGRTALRPQIQVLDSEFLDGAQRERLRSRLQRFVEERVRADLAALFAAETSAQQSPGLRGAVHALVENLGLVPGETGMSPELRREMKALGVRAGRYALFMPALLKQRALATRARLWSLQGGVPVPEPLPTGSVSLAPPPGWPPGFAEAMGWITTGPVLLRIDVAERISAELGWATRRGPVALPPNLASRFSVKAELIPVVLRCLGFRIFPASSLAPDEYGPPAPSMILPLRRKRPAPELGLQRAATPLAAQSGPFAALASLRLRAGAS